MSLQNTFQPIIAMDNDLPMAQKRRIIYIRPFLLFYLNSLIAEIIFLAVSVFIMTGTRDLFYKVMWTLVFCPLGMGGAMGGLTNGFIVDHYYGKKAAHFTGILSLLILSACNYLCYNLDRHFGWFGANEHPMWFHWRYPMIWVVGYCNGLLMFTDRGQERLARVGL
ncbi:uncharacterized protein AKAW2_10146A [Aspergillus luchuensis]|uniref:Uncharacterized protein n=1 Tax=Aspergillus kawachii TaxID=1069201 RepID=A0A146F9R0_ASPKA|nr:uncharacterized protein AKAW2_10146A [Aspergillus luchuensis]BCR93100.1 hypothetical protein AKAW2_10146A [Aspergillus luchuensis]BCS05756.1 hypothetical protein ALUC_10137A [Aspergillus luchuensis]GAT22974.1 hypothetical protein RIB2604_01701100 [Aspergillus luchuensis]